MLNNQLLSIVIPCKNEEANIAICLNSLKNNNPFLDYSEIILVDCCSQDETINIAKEYSIKIIQLKPAWVHTASAARYIGTIFSSGEFVFYIDADMMLEPGFLAKAIEKLRKNPKTAGIGGIGKEVALVNGNEVIINNDLYYSRKKKKISIFLGGSAVYRRKVVLDAGGFNPYLIAAEEIELAQRIRFNDHQLVSIPIPMIVHYTENIKDWNEFMRKKNAGAFTGIGQSIRLARSLKYFTEELFYYNKFLLFLLFVILELSGFIAIAFKKNSDFHILLLPVIIIFSILFVRNLNLKQTASSFVKWLIISLEIINGIMLNPKDPKTYPVDPSIIKGEFNGQK